MLQDAPGMELKSLCMCTVRTALSPALNLQADYFYFFFILNSSAPEEWNGIPQIPIL